MFDRWTNCLLLSILILLFFISTSVYGITCSNYQKLCTGNRHTWCCSKDKPCGNYSLQCSSDQKTKTSVLVSSSTLPTAIITIIVILAVICFVICLCCFISFHQQNQQRLRVSPRTPIIQRRVYSYQQGSSPNVRIRSDYDRNALSTYSRTTNIYEEPPPSYDVAVADFSPKYQSTSSSSPLPVTTSVEPTN